MPKEEGKKTNTALTIFPLRDFGSWWTARRSKRKQQSYLADSMMDVCVQSYLNLCSTLRITAQMKVNMTPDEAFMAGLGSNGSPSVLHRSAPPTSAHPLNGDVLKAFDKYNTDLQQQFRSVACLGRVNTARIQGCLCCASA